MGEFDNVTGRHIVENGGRRDRLCIMRFARLTQPIAILCGLGISVGIATAQPAASAVGGEGDGPLEEQPGARAASGESTEDESQAAMSSAAHANPSAALSQAQLQVGKLEAAAKNIEDMLGEARDAKDVVKVLCLDDKFNQVSIAVRSATARLAGIEAATASGNGERVQHDSAVLGALEDRVAELRVEADQCIGEDGVAVNGSELSVQIDPAIPAGEVALPPPEPVTSMPPVAASPTI